ncbi:MAG: ATP-dependent dethiobiotin synthetase BioD 1 [Candidatus Celerinatantimonas neptuna]|nr:MAG: ATP-dependent dethiobiotin synthetase BioD 1 [Candidatus Celerinatantimonas neptuna]
MNQLNNSVLFVTGTDTEVGKTIITSSLLKAFQAHNIMADGFKPVASGAQCVKGLWCNEDGLALQANSARKLPYDWINPNVFEPAIAPHIAAQQAGRPISIDDLDEKLARISEGAELVLIEGAGGWQVPLTESTRFADWVSGHRWPVVLVVGIRLGCINHALLSEESIERSGCQVVGWVANHIIQSDEVLDDNVDYLKKNMSAPLLGVIPHQPNPQSDKLADFLDVTSFLED